MCDMAEVPLYHYYGVMWVLSDKFAGDLGPQQKKVRVKHFIERQQAYVS